METFITDVVQPSAGHCWQGETWKPVASVATHKILSISNSHGSWAWKRIRLILRWAFKKTVSQHHSPLCSWWSGAWWRGRRQSGVVGKAVPSCCNRRCSRCYYCCYCCCCCCNSCCWKWRNAPLHWSPPSLLLPGNRWKFERRERK